MSRIGPQQPQPQATTSQPQLNSNAGAGPHPSAAAGVKAKSISAGAGNKDASRNNNQPASVKLPRCPEGQTMTPSGVPCERRGRKGGVRRKPGFRVPLKKEDGNMEAQIIEYNCEFPNRVVVRLEYLMQSTKVRLNDRHYMDDFYDKLLEEERIALIKATRQRERAEQNRMKKLIIDGLNKDIPPELAYLYKHPVFRVNQMLGRLKQYDTTLSHQAVDEEITSVEPYEYNGNQFFKHLHETGELWVPSEQRLFNEEKFEGKVYRAKLRLLQKRKEKAAEENILRILNNVEEERKQKKLADEQDEIVGGEEGDMRPPSDVPEPKGALEKEIPSWISQEEAPVKDVITTQPYSSVNKAVEKVKADAQKEIARLSEKIRRSKEDEKEHESLLDSKREEQESHYLDTFNYDKARIINNYNKRQKHGQVDELFNRPDYQKPIISTGQKAGGEKPKAYERIFQPDYDEEKVRASTRFGREPLFLKLQKVYGLGRSYHLHMYEDYDNELIRGFTNVDNGEEMMEFGDNVTGMYTREMLVADDYLKSRQNAVPQAKTKVEEEVRNDDDDEEGEGEE